MSRVRKARVIAAFGYGQYALAIATGVVLVPLTLGHLGARSWGFWLATGEVLNYASMVDLGMLGVLPWLLASAEGRGDRDQARRLISQGLWFGLVIGLFYAAAASVLWWWLLPSILKLSEADRALIGPPLMLLVVLGVVRYPLTVFRAALVGIQDVMFNGAMAIAAGGLTIIITVGMLTAGYGLYALACASAVPPLVVVVASAFRLSATRPDLMPQWILPRLSDLRMLFTNGIGVWVGDLGWQVLSASNGIVIAATGHPEWVPVYSCTAKLSASCMQLAWLMPDSGQVSLAQLHGEAPPVSRLREVVLMILRLHLLLAGGAALGLLVFNPAFVTRWVGPAMFGGMTLNVLLAVGVVFYSVIHGLITCAAVLGNRPRVGLAVLANGAIQLALAMVLARRMGLVGIAYAGLAAGALTSLPAGLWLLKPSTSITVRNLFDELVNPWLVRIAPLAILAAAGGLFYDTLGLWGSGAAAAALGGVYVWRMRPLYDSLPFDPQLKGWLVRWHLLSRIDQPSPVGPL
jgi:O-antigen/teichoic acid export membrane protein